MHYYPITTIGTRNLLRNRREQRRRASAFSLTSPEENALVYTYLEISNLTLPKRRSRFDDHDSNDRNSQYKKYSHNKHLPFFEGKILGRIASEFFGEFYLFL